MCKMVFSIQDKTDKFIKLAKDGVGVEFLGEVLSNCWAFGYMYDKLDNMMDVFFSFYLLT